MGSFYRGFFTPVSSVELLFVTISCGAPVI